MSTEGNETVLGDAQDWVNVLRLLHIELSPDQRRDIADVLADMRVSLTAATETAKRLAIQVEELTKERDARPVARWGETIRGFWELTVWNIRLGEVGAGSSTYYALYRDRLGWTNLKDFPTPEAAKAAVEEALRRGDCVSERGPDRTRPGYHQGFYDAQNLEPIWENECSPEYAAGWHAYWNVRSILEGLNKPPASP